MQTEAIERINEKGSQKKLKRFKFVKKFHMKEDNENIIIILITRITMVILFPTTEDFYLYLFTRLILLC